MNREQIMESLCISEGDQNDIITEKLFCCALIRQGTIVTEKVLRDYGEMKKILSR